MIVGPVGRLQGPRPARLKSRPVTVARLRLTNRDVRVSDTSWDEILLSRDEPFCLRDEGVTGRVGGQLSH